MAKLTDAQRISKLERKVKHIKTKKTRRKKGMVLGLGIKKKRQGGTLSNKGHKVYLF